MKAFSPGLALASFELLELVDRRKMLLAKIATEFAKIGVMPALNVLDFAQHLRWIHADNDGHAVVSAAGRRILSLPGYEARVRHALLDYIDIVHPPWIQNATFGRAKVIAFAGAEIAQVFDEAGLAHGTEDEVIEFWDALAARARGQKWGRLNEIGRAGERLTIAHEATRTQCKPRWISIDNNVDGYDVLSVAGPADGRPLSIEVKATRIGLKSCFHLTANEWEHATGSELHAFYLWDLSAERPTLAKLAQADIAPHIPKSCGQGRWESVEIPFAAFSGRFVSEEPKNV